MIYTLFKVEISKLDKAAVAAKLKLLDVGAQTRQLCQAVFPNKWGLLRLGS